MCSLWQRIWDAQTNGFGKLKFSIEFKTYPGLLEKIQKLEQHDVSYINQNIDEYENDLWNFNPKLLQQGTSIGLFSKNLEFKRPVITQTRLKSNPKLASFLYEKLVQAYKTHLKEEQEYLPPLPGI